MQDPIQPVAPQTPVQAGGMFAPCPKCGNTNATKVNYTWWGGFIGPKMFNHVKCNQCKTVYNGKTGKSNVAAIVIYNVALLFVCVVLYIILTQAG